MKKLTTLLIAFFVTAGMAFAQNNEATIDQIGDSNLADILQTGATNEAYVDQSAEGTQAGTTVFATADIEQTGTDNFVNIRQRAFFGFNEADILQEGDNNRVEGTSTGSAWYQNNGGGLLDVTMVGNDNLLYSLRSEAQKNDNSFILDILGNSNDVGGAQEFGTAEIDIEGDSNVLTVHQLANSGGHDAYINILGSSNEVDVSQKSASGGTGGAGNYAQVDLVNGSDLNMVDIVQRGSDHSGTVFIDGSGNISNISQYE